MSVRKMAGVLGAGVVVAVTMAAASAAWACSANVAVNPLSVLAGPPGTEVKVTGLSPGAAPVEIRWNGLHGPVLATAVPRASGEDLMTFSASVKIPDALAGTHYLVVVGSNGRTEPSWSRASFRIPRSGPVLGQGDRTVLEPTSGPLWNTGDTGTRGSDGGLGAGLVLLGIGGVGLLAAAGLLGLRRHRALAEDTHRSAG